MLRRSGVVVLAVGLAWLLTASCNAGPTYPTLVVTIGDDFNTIPFTPDTVELTAGSAIQWENLSNAYHLLVPDSGELYKPGGISQTPLSPVGGETRDFPASSTAITFGIRGIYHYRCEIHPSMRGVFIVN